jgi:hypothetical protein
MAIIQCPGCSKSISNMASLCPHCGFEREEVSDEQLEKFARRKLRDHIYRLKMSSYLVITVFLAAFGWYWLDTKDFQYAAGRGPILLLGLCALAYLLVRVLMYRARSAQRRMNRR